MKLKDIVDYLSLSIKSSSNDIEISSIKDIKSAQSGDLTYIRDAKYLDALSNCQASAILIKEDFCKKLNKNVLPIICDNPEYYIAKATKLFAKKISSKVQQSPKFAENVQIGANTTIGYDTKIGANSIIMPNVYIGNNVSLGKDCIIYPNASIYDSSIIQDRVIVHAGAVIGSDGFGYAQYKAKDNNTKSIKIYHLGKVIIEDDVEIGANSCIDRGVFNKTIIKRGTKIDNLVQIGHNCIVGEDNILCAHVGLSGSSKTGKSVILAGQVGVADNISIGDYAIVGGKSGVTKNLEANKRYFGSPAQEQKEWIRESIKIKKLLKQN